MCILEYTSYNNTTLNNKLYVLNFHHRKSYYNYNFDKVNRIIKSKLFTDTQLVNYLFCKKTIIIIILDF